MSERAAWALFWSLFLFAVLAPVCAGIYRGLL